jgi:hypothetical protein
MVIYHYQVNLKIAQMKYLFVRANEKNDWVNLKIIWKEGVINKVLSRKVLTKLITYPGAVYFSTKKNRYVKEPLVMTAARQKVLIGVGRFGV